MIANAWDMMEGTTPSILAVEPVCPSCNYSKIFIGNDTDELEEDMERQGWSFSRKRTEFNVHHCGCQSKT